MMNNPDRATRKRANLLHTLYSLCGAVIITTGIVLDVFQWPLAAALLTGATMWLITPWGVHLGRLRGDSRVLDLTPAEERWLPVLFAVTVGLITGGLDAIIRGGK